MVRDIHIVIKANAVALDESFRIAQNELFGGFRKRLPYGHYGTDDLHDARLIGAYHAHKALGNEWYRPWRDSLGIRDAGYIAAYELRGEWGRTDLRSGFDMGQQMMSGIMAGLVPGSTTRMIEMERAQQEALQQHACDNLAASWGLFPSHKDTIVAMRRLRLIVFLATLRVPESAIVWIMERWIVHAFLENVAITPTKK